MAGGGEAGTDGDEQVPHELTMVKKSMLRDRRRAVDAKALEAISNKKMPKVHFLLT